MVPLFWGREVWEGSQEWVPQKFHASQPKFKILYSRRQMIWVYKYFEPPWLFASVALLVSYSTRWVLCRFAQHRTKPRQINLYIYIVYSLKFTSLIYHRIAVTCCIIGDSCFHVVHLHVWISGCHGVSCKCEVSISWYNTTPNLRVWRDIGMVLQPEGKTVG